MELNYIGHGVLPPACFTASELLQRSSSLKISDIAFSNKCLLAIKKLNPTIIYHIHPSPPTNTSFLSFADSSLGRSVYGQTGYISGVYVPLNDYFYPLDWTAIDKVEYAFRLWAWKYWPAHMV